MEKTFKPGWKMHFYFVFAYPLIFVLLLDLIFVSILLHPEMTWEEDSFFRGYTIFWVSLHTAQILTFICLRIFYEVKYIIDDEYLIKYYGKEIIFKIKKSDIEEVYVQRSRWFNVFYCLIDSLYFIIIIAFGVAMGGTTFCGSVDSFYDNRYGSNLSFAFQKYEIMRKRKTDNGRISLKPEEKEDSFEISDFFSYRQSKQICKLLGKEPIMVKKSNGYIKTNLEQAENESPRLKLSVKTLGKRKRK